MSSLSSTFSSDKSQITTLNSQTKELTLGGSSGAWTFSNGKSQLLGTTAVKNLAWGSGTTTWNIEINNSDATISSTTSSYGRFLYNVSAPRFTTYTSAVSGSMLLPQLYRFVDESDPVREEAHEFVSLFMSTTAAECAALDVKNSTWTSLQASYSILSDEAKDYFYEHFENDILVVSMVERYGMIISKYGYVNFLTDSLGNPLLLAVNTQVDIGLLGSESALAITIIAFIGSIAVSIGGFVVFKKSRNDFYR
ncbi:MAG TPA: hypothetical protein PK030_04350 [Bacilli bacterium]|nr:hypothetical protein [Bacilli bacterium]